MRQDTDRLEEYRVTEGAMGTDESYGMRGVFVFPGQKIRGAQRYDRVRVIVDNGQETGWEHVSVVVTQGSTTATPSWAIMSHIKDLFWHIDECVVQYHPPHSEYVDCHSNVLHLWKPTDQQIPTPPPSLVGPKGVSQEDLTNV